MERRIIEEYALPLKHTFDYVNEKKDTWEILFEELLVWIGKGEVVDVG